VPLPADTPLPIPEEAFSYSAKAEASGLLGWHRVGEVMKTYFDAEVRSNWPDAWVDWSKTRLGYEIHVMRHFYEYVPSRPLKEIEADIARLTKQLVESLGVDND